MHSDDSTVEIARGRGARIVFHDRTGFVEPARRFAISHASCDWVLVLDADERMTPVLASRLLEATRDQSVDVVAFWSQFDYFGGWVRYGGFFHSQWRRFFRKAVYLETWKGSEESVHHNFEALEAARVLTLSSDCFILHLAYPTVEKYITKTLGMYARIEAEGYVREGRSFSMGRLLGEPIKEFLVRFFLRQGFRDGVRGLILTVLYSGYRFSVWANVWYLRSRTVQER
jgi:(heptosyl)LPS beta-1,4-glucosyltransferase